MKVMIIGAGKLGTKLATAMLNGEIHVTIMDNNPSVLERLKDHLDVLTITANGAVKEVLEEVNIASYDLIISVTSSDEINILISSIAKNLGCKSSIARIRNPEYSNQLDYMKNVYNIDHVINPELATSNEILRYLMESYTFHFGDYAGGKVSLAYFNIKNLPNFVNKSISQVNFIDDILIVAVSRNGDIIVPNGDTILKENDFIYVFGHRSNLETVARSLKQSIDKKTVKKVMILGGGKIGYYLAASLSKRGVYVKIIESDLDRCKYLADNLHDNTLVIHGNGTDSNLLEEEDLAQMDAFIGVTGYDEENLFMSLRAKQLNIDKVIAKISRQSYVNIIERLGIDLAINPVNITASDILKYIRGGRVVSVSLLLDGQAEVTEIIVSDNLQVLNKPIKNLNLPNGIIIASIVHEDKVIVPNGDSTLQAGDRIVVFSLLSEVPALENFFRLKDGF
ncbi:Trk system potassium transporter TrkA [Clostridium grantii]|uniref:Trk system potassium uptake protein TrkA n=1 Tax=Clostridium grantii DSM 8605 TaxID=1121316 RepID=A0A1M5SZE7_9CLOT|nr:Trk system potassium transporter TrkA [Clostridium grantii]SHH43852.1 trk system potassium uptake protein TrkA [Clostridium grantii DSM 8605]